MLSLRTLSLLVFGISVIAVAQSVDDPLAKAGIHVTGGAAPGYVPDRVCAGCHREIATSFQHVGMSQSFYRPEGRDAIETLGGIR